MSTLLLCTLLCGESYASDRIKLGLVTLDKPGHPFWGAMVDLAEAACQDLGIELAVFYAESSRANLLRFIQQAHDQGVDALIVPNYKASSLDILELAEGLDMPVFLINVDVHVRNRSAVGKPRGRFKNWLGRMLPSEKSAGYSLGKSLIKTALDNGLTASDGSLEIVAITGNRHDTPSLDRVAGLEMAVAEHDNVIVNQVVFAEWSGDRAYDMTGRLLARYPETTVLWTASDRMGLGVLKYLHEHQLIVRRITGGVDWTDEGITALLNEPDFITSVGGHVADGAWAAVLMYDYLNGVDFSDVGLEFRSEMKEFNRDKHQIYLDRIKTQDWGEIDFRRFSRYLNPDLANYPFSADVLFEK